ncbi:hypothetical protein SL003B_0356 [Polymorphum gilvum SL003B-26A1]|uniref:Uncharacterized protein n=1 Tax=Polymorphum gilvum (strain LMG 25793 / CGMCC 1.9160 / SL003B-26A1) TaxID=991905 RepID=F2J232_POLGS|nr:hypothetical protein SL003B_0356 [Polymorphum gilvum SL003B-26A1]
MSFPHVRLLPFRTVMCLYRLLVSAGSDPANGCWPFATQQAEGPFRPRLRNYPSKKTSDLYDYCVTCVCIQARFCIAHIRLTKSRMDADRADGVSGPPQVRVPARRPAGPCRRNAT